MNQLQFHKSGATKFNMSLFRKLREKMCVHLWKNIAFNYDYVTNDATSEWKCVGCDTTITKPGFGYPCGY